MQDQTSAYAAAETSNVIASDGRHIKIHGPDAFEAMRRAGRLAAECLDFITPHVKPGVTTGELDTLCHNFIVDHDAIPSPLNYRGFPKSICTSINHVVCHGIPGDKTLTDGDIINIDIPNRSINVDLTAEELSHRRNEQDKKGWKPAAERPRKVTTALKAYAKFATSADKGAVRDKAMLDD